jgi:NADH:ubiquinone oxidoreductase subunit 6 (subunit J)
MTPQVEPVTYTRGSVSLPVTLIVLLVATVVFILGHRVARLQRVHADYKATKAAVKTLRSSRISQLWLVVKVATAMFLVGVLMAAWVAHDIRATNVDQSTRTPSTVSPAPSRGHR